MPKLDHSTFLDFQGYRSDTPTVSGEPLQDFTVNVALVFERNKSPTELLEKDWGTRQDWIAHNQDKLWEDFGADAEAYQNAITFLAEHNIETLDVGATTSAQYVSSVESRAIWVSLNQDSFSTLFHTPLLKGTTATGASTWLWQGGLELPAELSGPKGVVGLWFDSNSFNLALPASGQTTWKPPSGDQSVGNHSSTIWCDRGMGTSSAAPRMNSSMRSRSGTVPVASIDGQKNPRIKSSERHGVRDERRDTTGSFDHQTSIR